MTLKNIDRWGGVSQTFHWLIVVLILAIATIGLTMGDLPKTPKYFWVYTLHKSLGIAVLSLAVLRLAWRLYAGAPPPVAGTPQWQERIASFTHWLLYALIFAMPLSGWLYDSASGLRPFRWFGLFDMPKLSPPNESVRDWSHDTHETLFWVLVLLVVAHAGAALYHHFIQNDATLVRMLPQRRSKRSQPEPNPQEPNDVA